MTDIDTKALREALQPVLNEIVRLIEVARDVSVVDCPVAYNTAASICKHALVLPSVRDTLLASHEALMKMQGGDYVLVPREPTEAMLKAGYNALAVKDTTRACWSAMIAAAPIPAQVGEGKSLADLAKSGGAYGWHPGDDA